MYVEEELDQVAPNQELVEVDFEQVRYQASCLCDFDMLSETCAVQRQLNDEARYSIIKSVLIAFRRSQLVLEENLPLKEAQRRVDELNAEEEAARPRDSSWVRTLYLISREPQIKKMWVAADYMTRIRQKPAPAAVQ